MITIAPGKHRMPKRRGMARAALSAAIQRPALTDPDWPPSGTGPGPRWYGPPLLHPDHPSAPVPRVRAPMVPGAGEAGRSPARSSSVGFTRSRPNSGPPGPAQRRPGGQPSLGTAARPGPGAHAHGPGQYPGPRSALSARPAPRGTRRQGTEQDAAAIRQEAAVTREAAEKEAAHLRAVILSLSEQLSQMSAYLRENLGSPGGLATMPAPAIAPPRPRARPGARSAGTVRPITEPERPTTARPGKPIARPTTTSQGRQARVARKMVAMLAILVSFGVVSGVTELALHGGPFFIFRANGAGASETGLVEDQGPGQPDAPGAHHATVQHNK